MKTKRDTGLNGHVTDDVTRPHDVIVVTLLPRLVNYVSASTHMYICRGRLRREDDKLVYTEI